MMVDGNIDVLGELICKLTIHHERYSQIFVYGSGDNGGSKYLPFGFPARVNGFMWPDHLNIERIKIVVCPDVIKNKAMDVMENWEEFKLMHINKKNKQNPEAFPGYDKPPYRLHDRSGRVYRFILMKREKRDSILFVGFAFDEKELDQGFWKRALDVRASLLNPKAPKPYPLN